jgi:hypothetical protein
MWAFIVIALIIGSASNKQLTQKCEQEVEDGIATSMYECTSYYRNRLK